VRAPRTGPEGVIGFRGTYGFVKFAKGASWGLAAFIAVVALLVGGSGVRSYLEPSTPAWYGLLLMLIGLGGLLFAAILILFFRDPDRAPGEGVVSPADGRVARVSSEGGTVKVSVHLGPLNVHVVRTPIAGLVRDARHVHGAHKFAFSKDAEANERLYLTIASDTERAELVLIAGAFANRIVAYEGPQAEVPLEKGQRVGLIKYGSRVDLTYTGAPGSQPAVAVGDKVLAGVTTMVRVPPKGAEPAP
jgi:phosphatidylserine decarboxylase